MKSNQHCVVWKNEAGRDRLNDWYDRFLERVETPTERVMISTQYGPSHVLVAGPEDGPPLICLHAMRTGASFMLSELGPILKRFRVYAPDLPGQSIRGPEVKFSLKDDSLAEWLVEVMDGLGLKSANLLGMSWGGFVARLTAAYAPKRVRKLVLVVPAGIANGSHFTGLLKMMVPMIRYQVKSSEENLKRLLEPILTSWDEQWAGMIACTIRDMKMDPRIPPLAKDAELRQLSLPTLVLAGDQDISFPGELIKRRLAEVAPDIEVELMKDCKHCPPTTPAFREWLGERVTRFLGFDVRCDGLIG